MQPTGDGAGICPAIGQYKPESIACLVSDGDNWQQLAARNSALPLADKQQVPVFHGGNRTIPSSETSIAFVGLLQVIERFVSLVFAQRQSVFHENLHYGHG